MSIKDTRLSTYAPENYPLKTKNPYWIQLVRESGVFVLQNGPFPVYFTSCSILRSIRSWRKMLNRDQLAKPNHLWRLQNRLEDFKRDKNLYKQRKINKSSIY